MKTTLSIIIPVYNAKKTIGQCLNSIKKQELKQKIEIEIIIIIDDGKKYETVIPKMKNGMIIKLIKTKGIGTGAGNARNIGLKKARGKYVGFIDSDDEWSENYLEEMINAVKIYGVVFASTKVYENNKIIKHFSGNEKGFLSLNDIIANPCSFHPFIKRKNQKWFMNLVSQDVYNTANILNDEIKVKMLNNIYYKMNIQSKSVTKQTGFSHKVNLAYKKYQIESLKQKKIKISKIFAVRRIININYQKWLKNNNGGYYDYIKTMIKIKT